jgi:hypothetical protein
MGLDIYVTTEDEIGIGYFRKYWPVVEDFKLKNQVPKKISLKKFKTWAKGKNWADRTTNEVKYPAWIYHSCCYALQEGEECIDEEDPVFLAMDDDKTWHNMIYNIIQQAEDGGHTHIIIHADW